MPKRHNLADLIEKMLLPVILGLVAGISGGMIAYAYFTIGLYEVPQIANVGRVTRAVTAPLQESELSKRLDAIVVPVFRRSAVGTGELANRVLRDEDAIGMATVLTSDGWLVTHEDVAEGQVLIGIDGGLKEPVRTVADARTGLVFLKVENGPLQVANFEETELLARGVPLFLLGDEGSFMRTSFGGAMLRGGLLVSDADAFNRDFALQDSVSVAAHGGAVLTIGGNLAGIAAGDTFIPVHLFRPILSDAFRGQELGRGALGVRYLDLSQVFVSGTSPEASVGARVTGSRVRGLTAVRSNSAAASAGLLEGDVILRVENAELTAGRDLAETVAEYRPGGRLELEVLREGERRLVQVELR